MTSFYEMEVRATVALDGDTRRCCNNPDCSNDYPCAQHPEAEARATLTPSAKEGENS